MQFSRIVSGFISLIRSVSPKEPMSDDQNPKPDKKLDHQRRNFLTAGASVVGGIGVGTAAWPFVASMNPSAHAKAVGAPVEVDLSKLPDGGMVREKWRGKPVWIVHRTKDMLASLKKDESGLRDPESEVSIQPKYAKNKHRSRNPEYLVLVGICTHLGCSPTFRPEISPADLGSNWQGGFFCACHGSRFDLAGRVYKNVPAAKNLEVPPYRFVDKTKIIIGESEETA